MGKPLAKGDSEEFPFFIGEFGLGLKLCDDRAGKTVDRFSEMTSEIASISAVTGRYLSPGISVRE